MAHIFDKTAVLLKQQCAISLLRLAITTVFAMSAAFNTRVGSIMPEGNGSVAPCNNKYDFTSVFASGSNSIPPLSQQETVKIFSKPSISTQSTTTSLNGSRQLHQAMLHDFLKQLMAHLNCFNCLNAKECDTIKLANNSKAHTSFVNYWFPSTILNNPVPKRERLHALSVPHPLNAKAPTATATPAEYAFIEQRLGRKPVGLVGIARYCRRGFPQVVIVSPLIEEFRASDPCNSEGKLEIKNVSSACGFSKHRCGSVTPFPTMFWLVDTTLVQKLSEIESLGWIKRMEKQLEEASPELLWNVALDHLTYISMRLQYVDQPLIEWYCSLQDFASLVGNAYDTLEDAELMHQKCCKHAAKNVDEANSEKEKYQKYFISIMDSLFKQGIGGIRNFFRIRCLHMIYAFHLIHPTVIGSLLDAEFNLYQWA